MRFFFAQNGAFSVSLCHFVTTSTKITFTVKSSQRRINISVLSQVSKPFCLWIITDDFLNPTWWKQSLSLGLTRTSTAQMFPGEWLWCEGYWCWWKQQRQWYHWCESYYDVEIDSPMIPIRPITETRMPSHVYLYHSTTSKTHVFFFGNEHYKVTSVSSIRLSVPQCLMKLKFKF